MSGHLQLEKNENTSTSIQKVLVSIYKQLNGDKHDEHSIQEKGKYRSGSLPMCARCKDVQA